jgi:hypothetical protein
MIFDDIGTYPSGVDTGWREALSLNIDESNDVLPANCQYPRLHEPGFQPVPNHTSTQPLGFAY